MISLGKDNNPGNARWCEEHRRLECVRNRSKQRGPCHAPSVRGADSCRTHAGRKTSEVRRKGDATISAWNAIGRMPTDQIDPGMAVLGLLQMSWMRLAFYSELLRQQIVTEEQPEPDTEGIQPYGEAKSTGAIGHRYAAAGKDGRIYAAGEEVRALVLLEADERDRVVKYAKIAHDMGVSKKLTDLAERWGDVVATRVSVMLLALNLTAEQEAMVPGLVSHHLSQVDLNAISGGGGQ